MNVVFIPVIDKSPRNSYLCVLQDGTCEWISFLHSDDDLVTKYEAEVENIVVNDVGTLEGKPLWSSAVAERKRKLKNPAVPQKKKQRLQKNFMKTLRSVDFEGIFLVPMS